MRPHVPALRRRPRTRRERMLTWLASVRDDARDEWRRWRRRRQHRAVARRAGQVFARLGETAHVHAADVTVRARHEPHVRRRRR